MNIFQILGTMVIVLTSLIVIGVAAFGVNRYLNERERRNK